MPNIHKRAVHGAFRMTANTIVKPKGLRALNEIAWLQCPLARAKSARVIPQSGQSLPVSQWNPHSRTLGSAGGVKNHNTAKTQKAIAARAYVIRKVTYRESAVRGSNPTISL